MYHFNVLKVVLSRCMLYNIFCWHWMNPYLGFNSVLEWLSRTVVHVMVMWCVQGQKRALSSSRCMWKWEWQWCPRRSMKTEPRAGWVFVCRVTAWPSQINTAVNSWGSTDKHMLAHTHIYTHTDTHRQTYSCIHILSHPRIHPHTGWPSKHHALPECKPSSERCSKFTQEQQTVSLFMCAAPSHFQSGEGGQVEAFIKTVRLNHHILWIHCK